jgi:hypothetical protein
VSGVWKQITTLLSSLMPSTAFAETTTISPTDSLAQFTLSSAGTYSASESGSSGTWRGGGASSDYDAYWTTTSGTLSGGTAGAWLNLGTSRTWQKLNTTNGFSTQTCVGTLQIRLAASPFTVLSTTTVTLTAVVEL